MGAAASGPRKAAPTVVPDRPLTRSTLARGLHAAHLQVATERYGMSICAAQDRCRRGDLVQTPCRVGSLTSGYPRHDLGRCLKNRARTRLGTSFGILL